MRPVWICTCRWEAEEPGDGSGAGLCLTHLREGKKAGQEHKILGLYDADTGEQLVNGLNRPGAQAAGYIARSREEFEQQNGLGTTEAAEEEAEEDRDEEGKPRTGAGKAKQPTAKRMPSNVQTIVEGWRLVLPAGAWGYFAIGRQRLRDDEGNPYEWTPQDMSRYVWDVFRTFHESHLGFLLGLTPAQEGNPEVVARMARIIGAIEAMTPDQVQQLEQEAQEAVFGPLAAIGTEREEG